MPAEESRVTIRLEQQAEGTMLKLTHEVSDAVTRDLLVQGWRFHFSLFANAVANYVNAGAPDVVDAWFALWTEPDAAAREATLGRIAARKVRFRDRYSRLDGIDEVVAPHRRVAAVYAGYAPRAARATSGIARERCWRIGWRDRATAR